MLYNLHSKHPQRHKQFAILLSSTFRCISLQKGRIFFNHLCTTCNKQVLNTNITYLIHSVRQICNLVLCLRCSGIYRKHKMYKQCTYESSSSSEDSTNVFVEKIFCNPLLNFWGNKTFTLTVPLTVYIISLF